MRKNRMISIFIVTIMMMTIMLNGGHVLSAEDIKISINDREKVFDQMPVMINDRVLIPMRGIFEALGTDIEWDEATQTVKATRGDTVIQLSIGSTDAKVNEIIQTLDVPAQIINDRTMVPVRFVTEALGAKVDWDASHATVVIKTETVEGVPDVLAYPDEKRPVPTEFTKSSALDDLIYYDMPLNPDEAFAKLPQGEVVLSNSDLINYTRMRGQEFGTIEKVAINGMPFTEALKATTNVVPDNLYEFQVIIELDKKFKQGDNMLFVIYARTLSGGNNETGMGKIGCALQLNGDLHGGKWNNAGSTVFDVGADWKAYYSSFTVPAELSDASTLALVRFGTCVQTVEVGGFQLINYGTDVKFEDMPDMAYYQGVEEDAQWRKDALNRIEQIRKGDINIVVKDAEGNPVSDADVKVDMYEHEFEFGVAISSTILKDTKDADQYRKNLVKYFNSAVAENDHKFRQHTTSPEIGNKMVDWSLANGIKHFRGHFLVSISSSQGQYDPYLDNRQALEEFIKNDVIRGRLEAYKGRIWDWDVAGELTRDPHERVLGETFDDPEMIEMIVDWFRWCREIYPESELYISQHRVCGQNYSEENSHLKNKVIPLLDLLVKNNADFDGIAVQGHMSRASDPITFYSELEELSKYGKKIKITEFDFIEQNKNYQANLTRDIMISSFSHPSVEGFYAWGPWDADSMDRILAYKDWTLKPSGVVYEDLVYNKWWTRESGTTDESGTFSTRGFYGDYEITVTKNGVTKTVDVPCYKGKDNTIVITMD